MSKHWDHGYTTIPNSLLCDKNIDPYEKIILAVIYSFWYVEQKDLSLRYIHGVTGISIAKISVALSRLVKEKYIEKVKDAGDNTPAQYRASNRFSVTDFSRSNGGDGGAALGVHGTDRGYACDEPGVSVVRTKEITIKRNNNKKNYNTPAEPEHASNENENYDKEALDIIKTWNSHDNCLDFRETTRNLMEVCLFLNEARRDSIFPTEIAQAVRNFQKIAKDTWMTHKFDLSTFLGLYRAKGIFRRFLDDVFHEEVWIGNKNEDGKTKMDDEWARKVIEGALNS